LALKKDRDIVANDWSPDGKFIVLAEFDRTKQREGESGKSEIYVRPFRPDGTAGEGKWQVSYSSPPRVLRKPHRKNSQAIAEIRSVDLRGTILRMARRAIIDDYDTHGL
jgi:hypothetical protein